MLKSTGSLVFSVLILAAAACSSDSNPTQAASLLVATTEATATLLPALSPEPPTAAPAPTSTPGPTFTLVPSKESSVTPTIQSIAQSPRSVVFPDDEGSHGAQLEWWYYNGHLVGEDGSEWGFHFVIFQARQPGLPTAYVGQLGLTDVISGDHVEGSTFFLLADAGNSGNLTLRGGDWELVIDKSGHRLTGDIGDASLTLSLVPQRPPVLHNEIGWLSGPTGWTYYYSWTRMGAVGSVRAGAEDVQVTGTVWMDHQWGEFAVPGYPAGWQWFAIQMDDGSDLMVTLNRDDDGVEDDIWGTYIDADGNALALREEDHAISIDELASWTSPHTGGEYPAGWRIVIDSLDLDIELWPLVADQEIRATVLTPIVYWEGKVSVTGLKAGRPVSARAYAELTGYAEPGVPVINFAP